MFIEIVDDAYWLTLSLQHAKRVRQDLETLKNFVVACRRREGRKLQQQTVIQNILSQFLLKKQPLLRMAFEDIMAYVFIPVY